MKIGIIGAGFVGLTAALRLAQKGNNVTLIEKEDRVGGLASGFRNPGWEWSIEKAYHHWFTNDDFALHLAKEINYPVLVKRPTTDCFVRNKRVQFDSPISLLTFPYLPIKDRLRTGFVALFLKLMNDYRMFEGKVALPWIRQWMGEKSFETIWDPLFTGKFGVYKNDIALTWFWARIKKRTPSLAYPAGGFQRFADVILKNVLQLNGHIALKKTVLNIESKRDSVRVVLNSPIKELTFDKVIVTVPTVLFTKFAGKELQSKIEHLHALSLVLILKKPFMDKTYWLNITDKRFPFLVVVEHTNFMDPNHYGGQHIVYIGNYLPREHRYFKMTAEELLNEFSPFLKRINPTFNFSLLTSHLFVGPFAQPIVTTDYRKHIPSFETPLPNVFLANLDMVYPWDRGTNYAIELGERITRRI